MTNTFNPHDSFKKIATLKFLMQVIIH